MFCQTSMATPGWSVCDSMSILKSGYLLKNQFLWNQIQWDRTEGEESESEKRFTWLHRCPHKTLSGEVQQEPHNLLARLPHPQKEPTPRFHHQHHHQRHHQQHILIKSVDFNILTRSPHLWNVKRDCRSLRLFLELDLALKSWNNNWMLTLVIGPPSTRLDSSDW